MTTTSLFLDRNRAFAAQFEQGEMPALPKLGTLFLTCIDARVDPAHVLGLELGEAVVFRNNGGRVTPGFLEELSVLSLMVARMTGAHEASFAIVLMQHTKCGAQSFADPELRALIQDRANVDVSGSAITNHENDLRTDMERLRDAPNLPGGLRVTAMLYDVESGAVRQIAPERSLAELRGRL